MSVIEPRGKAVGALEVFADGLASIQIDDEAARGLAVGTHRLYLGGCRGCGKTASVLHESVALSNAAATLAKTAELKGNPYLAVDRATLTTLLAMASRVPAAERFL